MNIGTKRDRRLLSKPTVGARELTFTAGHSVVPDHIAILENAGNGLRAMSLHKALLTDERDGAAQLKALTKTLSIHWHSRVRTLIVTKSCGEMERAT